LSSLLPEVSRVIYLDCDLVITIDLSDIEEKSMGGMPVAAVTNGRFGTSLEWKKIERFGYLEESPYFNSGVLLIDLVHWRLNDIQNKCLAFALQHSNILLAADQTVINLFFYKNISLLPNEYNYEIYPDSPLIQDAQPRVYHFTGSPKPFDLLGRYFNNNSKLYFEYERRLCHKRRIYEKALTISKMRRTVRIARGYYRQAAKKLF
jgi:lipopolysaccharide biosynthesis glycosyltransferase